MKILVLIAAAILCLAPLLAGRDSSVDSVQLISLLVSQSGIPNTVSAVILQARLYYTIGEVVVFTLASLGVRWLLSDARPERQIEALRDTASVVLCRLGATVAAMVAVELALRGHLTPGGGFAAGVAGGTAFGLVVISGSARLADRFYRRVHADLWEKLAVLVFIVVAIISFEGIVPVSGRFGTVESGGWIPLLNVLMAIKVTLGSWTMVQLFVRYRGLL
ncbi:MULTISPECIES: Na(+)/H(+) antiporter subunit B [unclassified Cyanobium]|uniref:Na(+)/H(+) antiporter subunit B n=1 Tax=unclassified Cyanobium TaxID=2627006 RepID=UPI0020CF4A7C|nr:MULTISPECIES: Na(+)/H(+) antiporter subunit B [unclassified Cyanobium]MCP9860488.1 Na(+)/H(+) antiporter subunit B [Cyanobium sp. Cruz-8H5]MCP9867758.1 Na(+)/H(+) antiporter subunit B [Cyanobium sp. Cruz-8D1]